MQATTKWGTLARMEVSSPDPAPTALPPPPLKPAASSFARVSLLIYTLLIVYASWYPFSGWRDMGLQPFDYLSARLPYYWTLFDLWTNIVGYIPLGMLLVFSLHPLLRARWAILPVIVAGALLSACMEAVQTYLPTRVPSNLDLATNILGTAIGALLGALTSRYFLQDSRLLALRQRWFSREASRGLVVVALWPLALIYPQNHLFGQVGS